MTTRELLRSSGIKYHWSKESKIGKLITTRAKENGIPWTKKEITVMVNDYPDTFIPEMEQIIIDYFKK